ncbi:CLUMA_CG011447, isoform A [Clunio marinus]|uniref:CLUMA_CG011447, isoform A n=1 Tax=Clunio marinus TaxID=568069 RepID=A0A1J1ICS1_9DIPT|nr:CLUMA_CG011447, isoform A [Clunio marinus]
MFQKTPEINVKSAFSALNEESSMSIDNNGYSSEIIAPQNFIKYQLTYRTIALYFYILPHCVTFYEKKNDVLESSELFQSLALNFRTIVCYKVRN